MLLLMKVACEGTSLKLGKEITLHMLFQVYVFPKNSLIVIPDNEDC